MWIPNIPLLFLKLILMAVAIYSAYRDNKYLHEYYYTGKTDKRTNFWQILYMTCIVGIVFGLIGQVFSFFVEYAP